MGIIDSGATASLGSAEALEMVMQDNLKVHGDSRMSIDTTRRPVFRFGNGQKRECISAVDMKIGAGDKQGSMTIHAGPTSFDLKEGFGSTRSGDRLRGEGGGVQERGRYQGGLSRGG